MTEKLYPTYIEITNGFKQFLEEHGMECIKDFKLLKDENQYFERYALIFDSSIFINNFKTLNGVIDYLDQEAYLKEVE